MLYGLNLNAISVPSLPLMFIADLLQPVLIIQVTDRRSCTW